ncbi:hypothetical protein GIB67_032019 [Kingdonia uniflora]|uniref:BCAS3 domain-containing protein n=1 Tax=Kingdonia uniflora TaxID=39325 RepID=A0A7J7MX22_9MAGN|nr:hypothetical protein GIB67_032019 [Kingdonia uniflora]
MKSQGVQRQSKNISGSWRGYLRTVSSGALSVASTVRSAGASVATSIVDRANEANCDQVQWAGFDKLEEGDDIRQVLLLGYRSGFQVWDVEEADNVHELVSRHDGPVSFLQMQQNPLASMKQKDKYADLRPLLVVAGDATVPNGGNTYDGFTTPYSGSTTHFNDLGNDSIVPCAVRFYSFKSQSYAHVLKFRSAIYSLRCSPRIVAVSQASQIQCFDTATLEMEYTILTCPIVSNNLGSGGIGYGPLAVSPRWLAYSGNPVVVSNTGRVSPQHLTASASPSSDPLPNGSVVAHYAIESGKQLANGIANLGDLGYKKLSRYCSDLLPDCNISPRSGNLLKFNSPVNGHFPDADNTGMVIVRDIVGKSVIAQFRAHNSPISALCFDPSGILLVTASVHGHNINVFRIMPSLLGGSSGSDSGGAYVHLYKLQRGFTNAVIQDISFSQDSHWIMISSSRGTSHLFAISPSGGTVNLNPNMVSVANANNGFSLTTKLNQQNLFASGPPVTLSVVSRIKNGNNGWRGTVTGSLSGAIASSFHNCKGNDLYTRSSKAQYHLLVFSPSGSVIQYVLRPSTGPVSGAITSGIAALHDLSTDGDERLVVEAIQKWDICQKRNRRDREDNIDIYGEHRNGDNSKFFPKGARRGSSIYPTNGSTTTKVQIHSEDRHNLYISEAELQMCEARGMLWAKPEIYFQLMIMDGLVSENEDDMGGGEFEIERIPSRMLESRSKDLIPVYDYLQTHKLQQSRISVSDSIRSGPLPCQKSGISEDERLSRRSSCNSLDYMSEGGAAVAVIHNNIEETGWGSGFLISAESGGGFVNNSDNPDMKTQAEYVNSKEKTKMGTNFELVNNNKESLTMENHIEDDENGLN